MLETFHPLVARWFERRFGAPTEPQAVAHGVRPEHRSDTLREMLTAAMSVNLSLVTIAQGEIVKKLAGYGYEGWFVVEAEQDPKKAPPLKMAQVGHKELMRVMTAAGYEVVA